VNDRIARGWDAAAEGYAAYYVPRFAPWVADGVRAIAASALPDGPLLVPCCGTFPELPALVEHLPGREIVGIDLSAGMVRLAREHTYPNVTVLQGDAATLDDRWTGACAAVVSVFGLQQLPDPAQALRSWAAALRPGGRLSVVFWPGLVEEDGPFALMREVLGRSPDRVWEATLTDGLPGLERDKLVTHEITHPDAAACFDAHIHSGPLRPFADEQGPEVVARLRAEFVRRAPAGELRHRPSARHIVVVRDRESP
jgi:SAM-dependent methyltransferase